MTAHAMLHLAAFSLMALALVLHPGLRRRACAADLVAAVCMIVAMADGMWLRFLPVVYSMTLLLAAAMAVAAVRGVRERRGRGSGLGACESSHAPLGFVATAVCLPAMSDATLAGGGAALAGGGAHHGLGAGAFAVLIVLVCGGYAGASVIAARHASGRADSAQYALMGAGGVLMALAAL